MIEPESLDARSGALEEARQVAEDARRIASRNGRLSRRQRHVARRMGEPRHRINDQQNRIAPVAKVFGNRHGVFAARGGASSGFRHRSRRQPPLSVALRRPSRSRNSRTSRPRSPTSAMTTVSNCGARASIASKRRFADAGASEYAHTLPDAERREEIDHAHTSAGGPDARALERRRRGRVERHDLSPTANSPVPSSGRPSESMTRPFQLPCGDSDSGRRERRARRSPRRCARRRASAWPSRRRSSQLRQSGRDRRRRPDAFAKPEKARQAGDAVVRHRHLDHGAAHLRHGRWRNPHATRRSRRSSGAGAPERGSIMLTPKSLDRVLQRRLGLRGLGARRRRRRASHRSVGSSRAPDRRSSFRPRPERPRRG